MKVYNKIVIDIKTGETLSEDSFEYDGPVARCDGIDPFNPLTGFGLFEDNEMITGRDPELKYAQSPEQREIYGLLSPLVERMSLKGLTGKPLYDTWQMPQASTWQPDGQSLYTGIDMWNAPDVSTLMPQSGWWSNMDPTLKSSIMEPHKDALNMITEQLGGSAGSARGGASGAAAKVMSEYMQNAAPQMAQQAWGMYQPAQQANYKTQLARNMAGYDAAKQERTLDYQSAMEYQRSVQQALAAPFNMLPGMMGGTYSSPVVMPGSEGLLQGLLGGVGQSLPLLPFLKGGI